MNYFKYTSPFALEGGAVLTELDIAYCTFGKFNPAKNNVIWICHALTANADAAAWWPGLVGAGKLFDPSKNFIVCANMLGSCYGSTGPLSIDPSENRSFGKDFPLVTIRDMVKAHELLRKHLGIDRIRLAIGGSMGGQQVLEWAIQEPALFDNICVLASNARHSPWGIAFNEAQRMAIEADPTLDEDHIDAGRRGLEAARAIAMLSYRNYQTYAQTQSEETNEKNCDFKAGSYQRYQGLKLSKRFDVHAYLTLSRAMDSHNVGRGRGGVEKALGRIKAKSLIIGIQSDVLFPVEEQVYLSAHIPKARLEVIDSLYGHDGFLIENEAIGRLLQPFLRGSADKNGHRLPKLRSWIKGRAKLNVGALPGTECF